MIWEYCTVNYLQLSIDCDLLFSSLSLSLYSRNTGGQNEETLFAHQKNPNEDKLILYHLQSASYQVQVTVFRKLTLYIITSVYIYSPYCFYIISKVLTRRICLTIKSFLNWRSFEMLIFNFRASYVVFPHPTPTHNPPSKKNSVRIVGVCDINIVWAII